MGLGGFIIGGALAGAGKGMEMQQQDDVVARREARLAALRAEERKEDRANTLENFTIQEGATARSQLRQANIDTARDNNKAVRETELATLGAAAEAKAKAEEEQRRIRLETLLSKLKINETAASKKIEAAIARGEIRDVFTDDEGNVTALYGDGKGRRVEGVRGKVTPAPKAEGGDSLLERAGGGAPKASATTPPKSPDQTPTVEDGYRYTPGPGGRANQDNWTKA